MIIVKLIGGLGNQMFQYALGRALAVKRDDSLKIDLSWYSGEEEKTDPNRSYELDHFNLNADFALKQELDYFKYKNGLAGKIAKKIDKIRPYYKRRYIREVKHGYDPNIINCQNNCYLDGYWQSENYFSDIRDILLADFSFRTSPNSTNQKTIQQISDCNSVALHIRRGDYLTNPAANSFHGLLTLKYYYQAERIIAAKIKDPVFFIFSDDPEWVKENLKLSYPMIFLEHNQIEKRNSEDLRLMNYCRNFIIANSSFSWWGAWLAEYKQKIIIAPREWFKNIDAKAMQIVPADWYVI